MAALTRRDTLRYLVGVGVASTVRADMSWAQEGAVRFSTRLAKWQTPRTNGRVLIDGVNVYYEEQGQGIPIVLCPGGRQTVEATRPLAAELGRKYRAISWDRPNTQGRSDVAFKGSRDVDMWADQLDVLLARLNARPAYLVGPSMGVRTNVATAVRYPDIVRGLFIFHASGNNTPNYPNLPRQYWGNYVDIADKGGMEAVVATPYWAGVIHRNPGNRALLLKTDPREFSRVMRRWTDAHKPSDVALNITDADLRRHSANGVPTRIIVGCDNAHSRETSERMAGLMPNAEFVDPPGFCEEWVKKRDDSRKWAEEHKEPGEQPYYEVSHLFSLIDDFVTRTEAKAKR